MSTNLSKTKVGIVTHDGILFCSKCFDAVMDDGGTYVYADSFPHNVERCNGCSEVVLNAWVNDYLDGVCDKAARNEISASSARAEVNDTTEAVEVILKKHNNSGDV